MPCLSLLPACTQCSRVCPGPLHPNLAAVCHSISFQATRTGGGVITCNDSLNVLPSTCIAGKHRDGVGAAGWVTATPPVGGKAMPPKRHCTISAAVFSTCEILWFIATTWYQGLQQAGKRHGRLRFADDGRVTERSCIPQASSMWPLPSHRNDRKRGATWLERY